MSKKICLRAALAVFGVCLILALRSNTKVSASVITGERAMEGLSYYLDMFYNTNADANLAELFSESAAIPENVAFANVNDYLNIRNGAGKSSKIIGYLPKNGM